MTHEEKMRIIQPRIDYAARVLWFSKIRTWPPTADQKRTLHRICQFPEWIIEAAWHQIQESRAAAMRPKRISDSATWRSPLQRQPHADRKTNTAPAT